MNMFLKPLANPFAAATVPTMADIAERVTAASDLTLTRQRDLLSALRRLAKLTGRNLGDIPADMSVIRGLLDAINPPSTGITQKTVSNLRSDLAAAMAAAGLLRLKTARVPLTTEWRQLHSLVDDRRTREGLSRFCRFCAMNGITPTMVNTAVLEQFDWALRTGTLARKANTLKRDTATLWNRLVVRLPDQGLSPVTMPIQKKSADRVCWSSLPNSFRCDLDAHLAWASGGDLFGEDIRARALAPRSITLRRDQVHAAVTSLIASGAQPETICRLADLVTTEAFTAILRHRHRLAGEKPNAFNKGVAQALVAVAKEWVRVDEERLAKLKRIAAKLPAPQPGLVEKNKVLLRNLEDPDLDARLIELPERLLAKALTMKPSEKQLACAQAAIAIAIQLRAGLRVANLASLQFGVNLHLPKGDGETILDFPAGEMKGRENFTTAASPRVTRMLRQYRDKILRPNLKTEPTYVFDDGTGKPKRAGSISYLIQRTTKRYLGVEIRAHQFRHLGGKRLLDAGYDFETARQWLGHRHHKTTVNSYTGIDTRRAGRRLAELVDDAMAAESEPSARRQKAASRTRKKR
jgi:integrase